MTGAIPGAIQGAIRYLTLPCAAATQARTSLGALPYLTDHCRCLKYPMTAHLPSCWTTEFIPEKLSHGRVMLGIPPMPADGYMISVLPAWDNSQFHFSAYWAIWKYIQLLVLSFPESNSVEASQWERLGKKSRWQIICLNWLDWFCVMPLNIQPVYPPLISCSTYSETCFPVRWSHLSRRLYLLKSLPT